jgi:hypothetical protein
VTTPDDDWAYLVEALDPLREPLHEALPEAAEIADGHFSEHDMDGREFQAGRAHLARCHARRLISAGKKQLGGWRVTRPGPNARLWLAREGLKLRLLRPLPGMTTPPPGPNLARIAYYSNHDTNLFGVRASDLIALWQVDNEATTIRIVRPIGKWRYGAHEKVDVDFYLPQPPTSLADLEFRPTDDLGLTLPFEDEDEEGKDGTGEPDPSG